MALAAPRFEDHGPMLLGGLRAHHQFETMALTIPAQWERFRAMGAIPGRVGGIRYGAICGTDVAKQRLEYMCAVEVETFAACADTGLRALRRRLRRDHDER